MLRIEIIWRGGGGEAGEIDVGLTGVVWNVLFNVMSDTTSWRDNHCNQVSAFVTGSGCFNLKNFWNKQTPP